MLKDNKTLAPETSNCMQK